MTIAAGAVLAALVAAGCGSSTGPASLPPAGSPAATAPAAQPAVNPVPILRQASAMVPPGVSTGIANATGLEADGTFGANGWETVTVYTTAGDAGVQAIEQANPPDDYHGVIVIPAKDAVVVVGAWDDFGPHWAAGGSPGQIAARVRGLEVMPAS